jgi:hypothetical protein
VITQVNKQDIRDGEQVLKILGLQIVFFPTTHPTAFSESSSKLDLTIERRGQRIQLHVETS